MTDIIEKACERALIRIKTKMLKEKKKPKKSKPKKKKRPINWDSIRALVKKYDDLSKKEKETVNWRHSALFWKRALKHHDKGLSDSKAIKEARAKK